MKAIIYSDKISAYAELAAAAKALNKEAVAFVIGSREDAEAVAPYVSKAVLAEAGDSMPEDFTGALKACVDSEKADAALISSTKRGRYMAGILAAAYDSSAMTDLSNIKMDGKHISGTRMYYAGLALSEIRSTREVAVVTLPIGSYEPLSAGAHGEIVSAGAANPTGIVRKEVHKKQVERVNLAAAKKVVGVGRGFSQKENLSMAEELAAVIGAELGCSRPIAEGEGWMSTDRYIGVSGVMLKPDVYFALGISGQIQHMIGVSNARIIIAVNKDINAPIFKQCDYGIVGDINKVLPALTNLVKG